MGIGSLDELRAFCAVAETRSFTAAAARLQVTTNGVSLRVRRLEEALGVRLFVRTTRRRRLTRAWRCTRRWRGCSTNRCARGRDRPDRADLRARAPAMPAVLASGRSRSYASKDTRSAVQTVSNNPIMPSAEGLDIAIYVSRPPEPFVGRCSTSQLGWSQRPVSASPWSPDAASRPHEAPLPRLLANPPQMGTVVDARAAEHTVRGARLRADDSRALGDTPRGPGIGLRPAGGPPPPRSSSDRAPKFRSSRSRSTRSCRRAAFVCRGSRLACRCCVMLSASSAESRQGTSDPRGQFKRA
jgi:DNA-binding transcriptional LysR family regulator